MTTPQFAHPGAVELLRAQLDRIETTPSLVAGAVAIARHAMPQATLEAVVADIRRLGDRVRRRLHSDRLDAKLAHLHDVLFDELGFTGDTDDYYSPLNSYLPEVLRRRRGIPVTLSLVYKAVAAEIGVEVTGINAPGHFLAAVNEGGRRTLVDPFFGGRILTAEEVLARLGEMSGEPVPPAESCLEPATNRGWLLRILHNLLAIFSQRGDGESFAAMQQLRSLL